MLYHNIVDSHQDGEGSPLHQSTGSAGSARPERGKGYIMSINIITINITIILIIIIMIMIIIIIIIII